jgi:hypothetical protein
VQPPSECGSIVTPLPEFCARLTVGNPKFKR